MFIGKIKQLFKVTATVPFQNNMSLTNLTLGVKK